MTLEYSHMWLYSVMQLKTRDVPLAPRASAHVMDDVVGIMWMPRHVDDEAC